MLLVIVTRLIDYEEDIRGTFMLYVPFWKKSILIITADGLCF